MHISNEGFEILKVLCGSRAYGLNEESSDYDYHSVHLVFTERLLAIGPKISEATRVKDGEDVTSWEVKHCLELALQCNPTVLETFIAPEINCTEAGYEFRDLFPQIVTRDRVFHAFRGYAESQRQKAFYKESGTTPEEKRRKWKAATAYLRTLFHGAQLLTLGTYATMIPDTPFRDFLIDLRSAKDSPDWRTYERGVNQWAEHLERSMVEAREISRLPTEPDMDAINAFLLKWRKIYW